MSRASSAVTSYQTFAFSAGTIIGVGVLVLPRWLIERAGTGAVLAMVLGSVAAVALAFCWAWVLERYPTVGPNATTVTVGVGSVARFAFIAALVGFFAVTGAMVAREFGEVIVTAVLTNTPLEVTVLLLLGLSAYMLRQPIQGQVRVFEILLPLMIIPVFLIAAFALQNGRMLNLLPVLGNNPSGLWPASLMALGSFEGMMVFALVVTIPSTPKDLIRPLVGAILLAASVHITVVLVTLAVFGPAGTRHLLWPTLELARITSLPGNVLERVEALFLAVWVAAVFTTLAGALLVVAIAIARVLRLSDHKIVVPWLVPVLYVIAMLPRDIQMLYGFILLWVKVGLVLLFVLPALMWVVSLASPLRRDKARPDQPSPEDSNKPGDASA